MWTKLTTYGLLLAVPGLSSCAVCVEKGAPIPLRRGGAPMEARLIHGLEEASARFFGDSQHAAGFTTPVAFHGEDLADVRGYLEELPPEDVEHFFRHGLERLVQQLHWTSDPDREFVFQEVDRHQRVWVRAALVPRDDVWLPVPRLEELPQRENNRVVAAVELLSSSDHEEFRMRPGVVAKTSWTSVPASWPHEERVQCKFEFVLGVSLERRSSPGGPWTPVPVDDQYELAIEMIARSIPEGYVAYWKERGVSPCGLKSKAVR